MHFQFKGEKSYRHLRHTHIMAWGKATSIHDLKNKLGIEGHFFNPIRGFLIFYSFYKYL